VEAVRAERPEFPVRYLTVVSQLLVFVVAGVVLTYGMLSIR